MTPDTLFQKQLTKFEACLAAREWVAERTARQAWDECERPDWMFWLIRRFAAFDHKAVVLAACACAKLSLKYIPATERCPAQCIDTVLAWTRGEASIEDVKCAYNAACAASADADYAAAVSAADAAVSAADAAAFAADAAAYADYAASAADYAADTAAYAAAYAAAASAADAAASAATADAARRDMMRQCAAAIREHIPFEMVRAHSTSVRTHP